MLIIAVSSIGIASAQTSLINGGNQAGTILANTTNFYTLTANVGNNIVLRLGTVGFFGNLRLYGPDGALLKTAASGTDAELDLTATNSGTFTALVNSYSPGGTGTYVLRLAQVPEAFIVPAGEEGGPMTNGGNFAGSNTLGDLQMWTTTANVGDNIVLRMGTVGFFGNLRLYGPDGALLKTAASGTDAELSYTATNSGIFTAMVGSYSSEGTGTYVLHLAQFPEPFIVPTGKEEGGSMTNGGNFAGSNTLGDLQMWSTAANVGDNIVLRLSTVGFFGNLRLYGPDGALLKTVASGNDAELAYTATNSGTFTALVSSYSSEGTGTYVLHLAQFPEPFIVPTGKEGGAMTNGGGFAGSNTLGNLEMWSTTANAGDNIVLRLGTVGFFGNLRLYGPDGELLKTAASGSDAELTFTPTNSGTFTALVSGYSSGGTGTYVLHLAQFPKQFTVPAGEEGGAMANGGNFPGSNTLGDLQMWSTAANAGDNIVLRLGTVGFFGNLRLYGPDGALLKTAASGTDAELDFTPTNSGTFTALVSSYSSGGTGTYVLHLAQFPEAFTVPAGDEGGHLTGVTRYLGTINLADLDMWTLTACTGDSINFVLSPTNFTGNLDLYGSKGVLLKTAASSTAAVINYTATNCGTFTLLVSSYSSGGSGTYGLTASNLTYETKLCPPFIKGANFTLSGVGGPTNAGFVLYSTTNLTTPFALWTSLLTNHFDQFGVFTYTNGFSRALPQTYFRFAVH